MSDGAPAPAAEPTFRAELRARWGAVHLWRDPALVIAFAVATGGGVVGFTLLAEAASHACAGLRHLSPFAPWLALLWTPALTVLLCAWTRRWAPGSAGSGIPQVMRALDDDLPEPQRHGLVSLRLSVHKVVLVSGGLLAGLSIGREGPTVQVGAGVMLQGRRWLSPRAGIDAHDLMVAGAAAGIAAAFNTPLGGIVFALEQLTRRRHLTHSALVVASIVAAGLVAVAVFGNQTYFGRLRVQAPDATLLVPGLLVAMVAGLAGGVFSRLVVASARGGQGAAARLRRRRPLTFAGLCGLGVAAIGLVTDGATAGAGYAPTRAMLDGHAQLPELFTVFKFCATGLSSWAGVPAGVFAPSLTIGAGIGHDVARLLAVGPEQAIPLIALGMVGFLAATTQGPITAFIIVMEMVSGQAMVLSLMASALVASGLSRLLARPMYLELAAALLPLPGGPPPTALQPGSPGPQANPTRTTTQPH